MSKRDKSKRKPPRIKPIREQDVPDAITRMKQGGPRVVAVVRLKGVGRGR